MVKLVSLLDAGDDDGGGDDQDGCQGEEQAI
jgi:hypothetical protein